MTEQNPIREKHQKPVVLLASTRSDDAMTLSCAVEDDEFLVVTAVSSEKIREFLETEDVALLIVDRDFSHEGGLETVARLRDEDLIRDVPLMVMADRERAEEASLCYGLGAVDFLLRPVESQMIKKKLSFFVERSRLKRQTAASGTSETRRINRALSDLAGGIAHQFNNTLNIITGHVELLRMDFPGNASVGRFSTMVFESVKRMTALTDKLLAYARTGNNSQGQVELNGLVSSCLSKAFRTPEHIAVDSDLDSGSMLIDADEAKMAMVVSAIMNNAVEAVGNSGRIWVRTRFIRGGDRRGARGMAGQAHVACLEIRDNGVGMSRDVADRMFEPFFSTKFQGRGLDMAAVQGIVTSHGGWIGVQTAPGEGTTVSVYLPVASYRAARVFADPEKILDEVTGTVLVIDDDDCIRDLAVTMLKRLGYKPFAASTGQAALEMAQQMKDRIDLAMIDIEIPDIKGDELYPRLKEICPDLKAIVCSGYSVDGRGEAMMKEGAQVFMQKPYSFGELAMNMRKLIERRKEKRYRVKDGHVLLSGSRETVKKTLVDISRSGAAIGPVDSGSWSFSGWGELALVSELAGLMIPGVPFRILTSGKESGFREKPLLGDDLLHLQFGALPHEVLSRVDGFIARCGEAL